MENSDQKFRDLLERYLNGTATPAERDMLDEFFESYQDDAAEHKIAENEREIRDNLLRSIHLRTKRKRPTRRLLTTFWLPLAAAITVFVVAYFFVVPKRQTNSAPHAVPVAMIRDSTAPGQRTLRVLPDGSKVYLNGKSVLTFPETFGATREVSLYGEGFFEVVGNGKPFIVRSGDVTTRVLGTSFNVRHRDDFDTEVTLVEGKVKVMTNLNDSLDLDPGEQAIIGSNQMMNKRFVNVMRYVGWRHNLLLFEETPFEDAIRDIEEWYAIEIDIANPSLAQCRITAKYQDEPMGNVLSSLQFLLGLSIDRLDDRHFLIAGNGCE